MLFLGMSTKTVRATADKDACVRMFTEALLVLTEWGVSEYAPVKENNQVNEVTPFLEYHVTCNKSKSSIPIYLEELPSYIIES